MAAVGKLFILKVFRAAVGGAAQNKRTLAALFHVGQVRAQAVEAHVRCQGDKVGLKISLKMRFCIHLSRFRNVAALDVGNGEQLIFTQISQRVTISHHAVHAECLIIGNLHFVAARHLAGCVNDFPVKAHQVFTGCFRAVGIAFGQIGKIGVQSHANRAFRRYGFIKSVHLSHVKNLLKYVITGALSLLLLVCFLRFFVHGAAAFYRAAHTAPKGHAVKGRILAFSGKLRRMHGVRLVQLYHDKVSFHAGL